MSPREAGLTLFLDGHRLPRLYRVSILTDQISFQLASPDDQQIVCLPCAPEYFFPDQSAEELAFSRRFIEHTRAEMAFYAVVEEEGLNGGGHQV